MTIFKCKMCSAPMEVTDGMTVCECEYCGTKQTLPKLDNDSRLNLYDRANHFRRNNEYDKAMGIYERILNEDKTDAEAYWSLVLCRYGIEYVEDPLTHKRVPTVNRAQFTSVYDDDNYKLAIEYADVVQRQVYEDEANAINEIQKSILAISQKEEPFDVFICYKETDNDGRRTRDSVLATDLYHQLINEGFKVFFSRITLEDKLGTAYEPYIFAALNSAKVMVVLGTKPEFFNAVWVKNEWSRYLALIKQGQSKMLIPAYRDMDPYDLPEEFSHLQAQDMSKLGFMQDLVRGIKKIAGEDETHTQIEQTVVIQNNIRDVEALLKRMYMFLEDKEWENANEYCERILDINPECAEAYLGKLMSDLKIAYIEDLKDLAQPFDRNKNYDKIVRFADEELKERITGFVDYIKTRNENNRLESIYSSAKNYMLVEDEENYKKAAELFRTIEEYKESKELIDVCYEKAEIARKDAILKDGKAKMTSESKSSLEKAIILFKRIPGWKDADEQMEECNNKIKDIILSNGKAKMEEESILSYKDAIKNFERIPDWKDAGELIKQCNKSIEEIKIQQENKRKDSLLKDGKARMVGEEIIFYEDAIKIFKTIPGWKDADEQIKICNGKIKSIKKQAELDKNKKKITLFIISIIIVITIVITIMYVKVIFPKQKFNKANDLVASGEYEEAYDIYEELGENELIVKTKKIQVDELVKLGKYEEACFIYEELGEKELLEKTINKIIESEETTEAMASCRNIGLKGNYEFFKDKPFIYAMNESISAGPYKTIGLRSDGTIVSTTYRDKVTDWTDIVAVSTNWGNTVGLRSDGTVVSAGDNSEYQYELTDWTDIVAVCVGENHTVGLRSDGTVLAAGDNNEYQCEITDWTDIVAISAGGSHTVGLRSDGTVVAVGDNSKHQCEVTGWTDIVAISAGGSHTVGLRSDGTVVATEYNMSLFGSDYSGQCEVTDWTDIVAVSAGEYHTVGLRSDGTVVSTPYLGHRDYLNFGQCEVTDWTDIVAVSAGCYHTVGLRNDGTVVATECTDDELYNQCGVTEWNDIAIVPMLNLYENWGVN